MMHRLFCPTLIHALLAAFAVTAPAGGEDSVYDGLEASYQSEAYASLLTTDESRTAAPTPPAETFLAPSLDVTAEGVVNTIPATSWHADVELVAFRPEFGGIDFTEDGEDVYYVTPRFTLGWESKSGYGVRGRLWGLEAETKADYQIHDAFASGGTTTPVDFDPRGIDPDAPILLISSANYILRTGSFDVDFYRRFVGNQTNLVFGAGLKSAGLQLEIPGLTQNSALGSGLGLFSDVRHVLRRTERSELSLVGSGRVGFLTGEWRNKTKETFVSATLLPPGAVPGGMLTTLPAATTTIVEEDVDMVLSEVSLGVEWRRDLSWSVLTLRAQYETQLWNTDVSDDLTFNGGAVKAGLAW